MGRSWQGIALPEGVEITAGRTPYVGIRFRYRGVRCRELSIPIQETKSARRYIAMAADKLATIRLEMELGTFRYGNHFPDSQYAKRFGEGNVRERTVREALTEWLDSTQGKVETSTYTPNKRIVENVLIPMIGDRLVATFTALDAASLIEKLAKQGRVGKTVRNVLLPIRGAFDRELMAKSVESNPFRNVNIDQHLTVEAKKHRVPLPQPFNEAERAAILKFANPQLANLCSVWWGTGMSEGEIMGLEWPDLDFVGKKINLSRVMDAYGKLRDRMKTKTRHRSLDMSREVEAALIRQKALSFLKGKEVFQNPATGERWATPRAMIPNQWRSLLKRAGVAGRGPNQCRHTYAAIRIGQCKNVADLWKLSEDLGHRGLEMLFKHYGSLIKEHDPHALKTQRGQQR